MCTLHCNMYISAMFTLVGLSYTLSCLWHKISRRDTVIFNHNRDKYQSCNFLLKTLKFESRVSGITWSFCYSSTSPSLQQYLSDFSSIESRVQVLASLYNVLLSLLILLSTRGQTWTRPRHHSDSRIPGSIPVLKRSTTKHLKVGCVTTAVLLVGKCHMFYFLTIKSLIWGYLNTWIQMLTWLICSSIESKYTHLSGNSKVSSLSILEFSQNFSSIGSLSQVTYNPW